MSEDFWSSLNEGEIYFRDSLQFEVRSDFFINPKIKKNVYKQEFYIFIPNTLQINEYTYSRAQFYQDQTTLIRYKTPRMTFEEIIETNSSKSPLSRLQAFKDQLLNPEIQVQLQDELQLFGNVFRAALRERILDLLATVEYFAYLKKVESCQKEILAFCQEVSEVRLAFIKLQGNLLPQKLDSKIRNYFRYTDEYTSLIQDHYVTALLQKLRLILGRNPVIDQSLCDLILKERAYREQHHLVPKSLQERYYDESYLYREGLLNKFMLEALLLKTNRRSFEERHGPLLASLAAACAMGVYTVLLAVNSPIFVINSYPFILLAVVLYVLKDRLKEGLKRVYFRHALKWFPDYSTEIQNPNGNPMGVLDESFEFINETQLPPEFLDIRNRDYHEELEILKRKETIILYTRDVVLNQYSETNEVRRRELTTLFRFNIHQFLKDAHDAYYPSLYLDSETFDVVEEMLPRVYHLNIIIRNTYLQPNLKVKNEIKKFRVIVNKLGIKRVEQIK